MCFIVLLQPPSPRIHKGKGAAQPSVGLDATRRHVFVDDDDDSQEGRGLTSKPSAAWRHIHQMRPNTADNVIRHRYSDPDNEAKPAPVSGVEVCAAMVLHRFHHLTFHLFNIDIGCMPCHAMALTLHMALCQDAYLLAMTRVLSAVLSCV